MANKFNYDRFKDAELIRKNTSPIIQCKIESSRLQYIKAHKLKLPEEYTIEEIMHSRSTKEVTII